jgi:hypothetical protein
MNDWIKEVRQYLPHLSKPQAVLLSVWSFVMVLIRCSGIRSNAAMIAELCEEKEDNVRQRMREFCWEAKDKAGKKRQAVVVVDCFVPLLLWILHWWAEGEHRLALALDATTLGDRYVVLALSVLYRGCAIPIAWKVFAFTKQSEWKPEWLALLARFEQVIPADWTVIVLADRGLYADWLFAAICKLHWHPFLRINANGKYRAQGASEFLPLRLLADRVGGHYAGAVTCFKNKPVEATLLITWQEGYEDPWLILTDLPPEAADIAWYALRAWIECGFKHTKRAGWQWQATHMTDPARAERHWLVMAVATLWAVSVGGEVDASLPASTLDPLPPAPKRSRKRSHPRLLSCFRLGCFHILSELLKHKPLPLGAFHPDHDCFY